MEFDLFDDGGDGEQNVFGLMQIFKLLVVRDDFALGHCCLTQFNKTSRDEISYFLLSA